MNYFYIFKDAVDEKGLNIKDVENAGILKKDIFYNFSRNCPSLKNAIKLANFLEMSLDYILGKYDENNFSKYSTEQKSFYQNLNNLLKANKVSKYRMGKDLGYSNSTFIRWKHGTVPKLSTIIDIANYLKCDIDELLEHE